MTRSAHSSSLNEKLCVFVFAQLLLIFVFFSCSANAEKIEVKGPLDLSQALDAAKGGDIIELTGEEPYSLLVKGHTYVPAITLTSKSREHPVSLTEVGIFQTTGVNIDHIKINPSLKPNPNQPRTIQITQSHNIVFSNCIATGSAVGYLSEANAAASTAENFAMIRWSSHIEFSKNKITNFMQGLAFLESTDIKIEENDVAFLQGDSIRMGGVQRVDISDNSFHDFFGADTSINHEDMIQIWSTNAELVSSDITISHNRFLSGNGPSTQSIFVRNEQADGKVAAPDRFYSNITVVDNLIHNGHSHGITIGETNGVIIKNNTLLPNPSSSMGTGTKRQNLIPSIKVCKACTGVVVDHNVAGGVTVPPTSSVSQNYNYGGEGSLMEKKLSELYTAQSFAGKLPDEAYKVKNGNFLSQNKIGSSFTF